ncbi:MAG: ABC-F family ATP-binding cassette domain-containing protein [Chloroflexota bacterium]
MLRVSALAKAYGADPVLRDISFVVGPGEKLGLVGPNGSGKSTLLQLIAGTIRPDAGSVRLDPGERVAYLPQYPEDTLSLTLEEALVQGAGRVGEVQRRMGALERAMQCSDGDRLDSLMVEYAEAREEFERLDGYTLPSRMDAVVRGLSLDVDDPQSPVASLSGGNKTRVSLARLLLSDAQVVLLDEPTNFLDLGGLLWLERFVVQSEAAYIIVSHDRRFLDRTVSGIIAIDPKEHTVRQWVGTYSDYADARRREEQKEREAYLAQQEEIRRVEDDIRRTKEQARTVERHVISGMGADVQRRRAKKVARKATVRERKLERHLENDDLLEKPVTGWNLHLGRDPIEDERVVLEVDDVRSGYGHGDVLRGVSLLLRGRDRVVLLGDNGSGKSTLVRCITGALPYRGAIRIGASVRIGVFSQEQDTLPLNQTVLEVFRSRTDMYESDARSYLHRFLFAGREVFKPVSALSYGQRAKLALAMLVLSEANFLLLDEPTSHLDLAALEAMEEALASYTGPLLLISHDRYFVERAGITRVEVMQEGTLSSADSVDEYERRMMSGEVASGS